MERRALNEDLKTVYGYDLNSLQTGVLPHHTAPPTSSENSNPASAARDPSFAPPPAPSQDIFAEVLRRRSLAPRPPPSPPALFSISSSPSLPLPCSFPAPPLHLSLPIVHERYVGICACNCWKLPPCDFPHPTLLRHCRPSLQPKPSL
jgi:hypothetical protein